MLYLPYSGDKSRVCRFSVAFQVPRTGVGRVPRRVRRPRSVTVSDSRAVSGALGGPEPVARRRSCAPHVRDEMWLVIDVLLNIMVTGIAGQPAAVPPVQEKKGDNRRVSIFFSHVRSIDINVNY